MYTIRKFLSDRKYSTASEKTYEHIEDWFEWYQGNVEEFHRYNVYNGISVQKVNRMTLGMAKRVCEDWANLLLNEKVSIVTDDESLNDELDAVLEYNNFRVKGNQLVEIAFALGTGALVEYAGEGGEVTIDYVRADMIYPIRWENGDIIDCAFASHRVNGGREYLYVQVHELKESGYVISNHCIDSQDGKEMDPAEIGVEEEVETGTERPFFQIITPNIVNNIDLNSPMGISIYGNCIDQLKSTDLVYDSYANEFILGKKRITVPMSMAKIEMNGKTGSRPVFDSKDTVFYAIPNSEGMGELREINMSLRASEHELALQKNLDLLSFKCGLGNDRFEFGSGGVKTATEVISEKSELYQNMGKHKIIMSHALKGMVRAVAYLLGRDGEGIDVVISFDDSIIQDSDSERNQDRQDLAAGIMSKLEYRMKWYGEDEKTAAEMLPDDADIME